MQIPREFDRVVSRRSFLAASAGALGAALIGGRSGQVWALQADGQLIIRSSDPLNAEPSLPRLVANAITPVKDFYVRNHGPIPKIDAGAIRLRVEGMVSKPQEFSLGQIQERFRQQSVEATLICGGNRRQEISAIKSVSGVQWNAGAIGNARWNGAMLADILRAAELKEGAKHVWFEGLDQITEKDGSVGPFGGSIPLDKALAADAPVLLAHAMNDEPLTAEHGAPLRTIVPGYIGARSVKWLTKLTLSDRPSPNHYVADAYKIVADESKEAAAAADPIYAFPVNAAICSPAAGAKLQAGRTTIAGYALATGEPGCRIEKVEVSHDGGKTWTRASFKGRPGEFVWQLWTAELDLPAGRQALAVRAADSRGNVMPERGRWNPKGYLYNGWHHVSVDVA